MTQNQSVFLDLVRLGIGVKSPDETHFDAPIDWSVIQAVAQRQWLAAIVLDGVEKLPIEIKPPKTDLLQWIGDVLQKEQVFATQNKAAAEMALLFKHNHIRSYVLKGAVVAECYPKPEHRASADMDCFLLSGKGDVDAWSLGNDLVRAQGFNVDTDFYKNSTFFLPGLTVENHKFMTPFRGNNKLKSLEIMLQGMIKEDAGNDRFDDSWLCRPPVMVTALFLIEHAFSHFLHQGMTWRHVLDWMMFSRKHKDEIDWATLNDLNEEYGFQLFYYTYNRLGQYMLGEITEEDLSEQDYRMLRDLWDDLDLHETTRGIKGKIALAGNTVRARWKYKYFTDMSMVRALWIQIKGFLFIRYPSLD